MERNHDVLNVDDACDYLKQVIKNRDNFGESFGFSRDCLQLMSKKPLIFSN